MAHPAWTAKVLAFGDPAMAISSPASFLAKILHQPDRLIWPACHIGAFVGRHEHGELAQTVSPRTARMLKRWGLPLPRRGWLSPLRSFLFSNVNLRSSARRASPDNGLLRIDGDNGSGNQVPPPAPTQLRQLLLRRATIDAALDDLAVIDVAMSQRLSP